MEKPPASDSQTCHCEEQRQQHNGGSIQPVQEPSGNEQCDLNLCKEDRYECEELLEWAIELEADDDSQGAHEESASRNGPDPHAAILGSPPRGP